MRLHLYVVVTPASEDTVQEVENCLGRQLPGLSFSPAMEQASLENCMEFHATADCSRDEALEFLHWLNNDPDGKDGEYWAYGFNTRMADPAIYYFRLEF